MLFHRNDSILPFTGLLLVCFVLVSCDTEEKRTEDKQPGDKKPKGDRKHIPLVRELTNE